MSVPCNTMSSRKTKVNGVCIIHITTPLYWHKTIRSLKQTNKNIDHQSQTFPTLYCLPLNFCQHTQCLDNAEVPRRKQAKCCENKGFHHPHPHPPHPPPHHLLFFFLFFLSLSHLSVCVWGGTENSLGCHCVTLFSETEPLTETCCSN